MSRFTQLQFFVHEDGVISGLGDKLLWPILDYEGMKPENNFQITYNLTIIDADFTTLRDLYTRGKGTRKIPLEIKNEHRKLWGLKPVKSSKWSK